MLGRTGLEALELVRGAVRAAQPDALIVIDALASRSLSRLCTSVQLSDTGIVPGSGVGNHRRALTRETLGLPDFARSDERRVGHESRSRWASYH